MLKIQTRAVSTAGCTFAVDEAGSGHPLLLLHAGCADRRMWRHQLTGLSQRYRVICYDMRGFGESEDAARPFAHHTDLLALMDALGLEQAAVAGSSDGGRAALDAVLASPERFTSLALVAPGLSGHQWPAEMADAYQARVHSVLGSERLSQYRSGQVADIDEGELARYAEAEAEFLVAGPERSRADLPADVWELAVDMDRSMNRRWWRRPPQPSAVLDPPAADRLAELRLPTLVIIGLADVPAIRDLSERLGHDIAGARVVRLPDTGHLPPLERPVAVNTALLRHAGTRPPS
jgi:pimeloyl-ACP methyl ester carboxylesterase